MAARAVHKSRPRLHVPPASTSMGLQAGAGAFSFAAASAPPGPLPSCLKSQKALFGKFFAIVFIFIILDFDFIIAKSGEGTGPACIFPFSSFCAVAGELVELHRDNKSMIENLRTLISDDPLDLNQDKYFSLMKKLEEGINHYKINFIS